MHSSDLAVYTTIYPGVEGFLSAWHHSVLQQTDRNFDLWIGLDTLSIDSACRAIGACPDARWVTAEPRTTPADLRQRVLTRLVSRYRAVIFVDSDDLLGATRVQAARDALAEHDVVGCALRIGGADGSDLGLTFGVDTGTDLHELLPRYNVFGLSNSAYRTSVLSRCLPLPPSCVLMDWLLATRALVTGASLWFDEVPRMTYRQHGRNCAPVLRPFSAQQVLKATVQVVHHYRLLLEGLWEWPMVSREPFLAERARVEAFLNVIRASPRALEAYVAALNEMTPRYVWWWAVAHPDLEDLWKHSS